MFRFVSRRPQDFPVGYVYLALGVSCLALAVPFRGVSMACPLKSWTGLPCPTCGSTRLVRALLDGEVLAALLFNPFVFCAGVGFVSFLVLDIWAQHRKVKLDFASTVARKRFIATALVCLVLNQAYLISAGI